MNEIKIWNYDNLEIRTIEKGGESWWVLSDVCKVLELSNPSKVAQRLDEDERSNFELGRQGTAIIINESGLYSVILRSDKPEAKLFRRWVTHEVLPEIHRTGKYSAVKSESILDDPRLTASAKAIFMYLCSRSGGKSELNTNRKKVLHDLNIGPDMYKTHLDKLKNLGYVSTERIRGADGRIGGVKFIINYNKLLSLNNEFAIGE